MKLRRPWLIHLVGLLGALVLRLWMGTLRYRLVVAEEGTLPNDPHGPRRIYAFWHESILVAAALRGPVDTLISQHADGELIAQVCRHLRIGVVRGSSSHGGDEALVRLWQRSRRRHLALTPDGPRGPRRQVKRGLAYLASQTGLSVVGGGIAFSRAWRFRSWDRFALPWPWSTVYCVLTPPVQVPPGLTRPELERYRRLIQDQLLLATQAAERWADRASGRSSPPAEGANRVSA